MNLSTGCAYCGNLISHDAMLTEFSCAKKENLKIENAGACFVACFGSAKVIIESCPMFEHGKIRNLTTAST